MSAPLKLDIQQLRQLATALEELSRITKETGVTFTSYGQLQAEIGDSSLRIYHDGENYIVDDRNGN
jgi:hypothetical protein